MERVLQLAAKRAVQGFRGPAVPSKFDNVVIAMSGGVDSSVAAAMFAGYPNVRGVYMQNWSESQSVSDAEPCYERDWRDAQRVGEHLGIPVEKVNFESDYWIDVFEPMLQEYDAGRTPNPDIGCNRFVKFGKMRQRLDEQYGAGNYWLVTGHYSRVLQPANRDEYHLLRSFYRPKDQSYYLSQIDPKVLNQLVLPMGHLTKPEVRELAQEYNVPTADKRDSQGICFVNNSQHKRFNKFLEHYLQKQEGDIITVDDGGRKVWGKHQGMWSYTLGQKIGGISLPQADPRYTGAWYVSEKRLNTNELVIVRGRENPKLYHNTVLVSQFLPLHHNRESLLQEILRSDNLTLRYRSLMEPTKIDRIEISQNMQITLQTPQRAMAPGQYACLLSGDRVLGSGPILKTL
ncbi:tRNA-5-taurinomethyluridine 2-sulfurtransferase [Nakaseomyces bracarensis]|uniref:tRNA-5-taurinomethyluridine 2-sulfurtransferase n=1 Tax=Nakaseomyces bracarensis TaxID=273131 RepID=UPI0038722974